MKNRIRLTLAALIMGVAAPFATAAAANTVQSGSESATIASGSWTKKSFAASGTWSIVDRGGKRFVVLSKDFSTRSAPDLKIFLSPLSADELNGRNATNGAALIAPLASNSGAQEYEIPASVDLADYQTIIIHCEAYAKLWSVAEL